MYEPIVFLTAPVLGVLVTIYAIYLDCKLAKITNERNALLMHKYEHSKVFLLNYLEETQQ
jgi:hypothetical protein